MSMFYIEKPENSVDLEETTKELQNIEKRYKKFIKKNKKDVKNRIYKNFLLPVLNRGIKQMERNKGKNKVHLYWGKDVFCLINQTEKNRRVPDIIETMIRTGTTHYSISIEGKLLRMGMIPDGIDIPKKPKEKRAKYKLPTNRKEDRKMFHLLLHYFNPDRAKENESDLEDVFFKEVCTDGRMDPEKVLAYHLPKNQKEDKRLFRLLCNYFNTIDVNMLSRPDETMDVLFNLLTTEGRMDPAKLLSYLAINKFPHLRIDPDTGLIIPEDEDTSDEDRKEESVEDVKESPKEESEEDATADVEESEESSDAEEEPISEDSSDEEEFPHLYLNEIQHRHPLDPRTFPKYHKGLNKDRFEELLKECLQGLPTTIDDIELGSVFTKMITKMTEGECPSDTMVGKNLCKLAREYATFYEVTGSDLLKCALRLMTLVPKTQYNSALRTIRKFIDGVDGYPILTLGSYGDVAISAIKKFMDDSVKEWGHYIDNYRNTEYLRNPIYQHGRYIYVPEEIGVHVEDVIDGAIYCIRDSVQSGVNDDMERLIKIYKSRVEPSGTYEKYNMDEACLRWLTAYGVVYMEEVGERILSEEEDHDFAVLHDNMFHRMITAWLITKRPNTADLYVPGEEEVEEE